ncbi:MAG: glycosyltransferase family 9 protein [Xanthomonadales bacterium]|nr:glycosyltransferase family 9 protein [Xanthomonadales bacterium]
MPDLSICIMRLSAIGDVTHVVPVIHAIRTHLPQSRITWIIGKLEARLLNGLPGVEFIVFDKKGGFGAVRELRKTLKNRKFNVLLHMQVAARANLLSTLVKSPTRIGWDKSRWRDRHQWFINQSVKNVAEQHQVEAFLEFAQALGAPAGPPIWNLPVSEEDINWARQTLGDGPPILMISPCSSHALRNWQATRYAEVADHAISELGMQVVLTGGPSALETATGQEIKSFMQNKPHNLIGKDTICQSVALLKQAAVVLSPDSGPAHLASAVGTPVIGLYAATPSKRSGPYNSLDLCVDRYTEAARKFRHKEPQELRWGQRIEFPGVMDLIETPDVIEKLDEFMRRRP